LWWDVVAVVVVLMIIRSFVDLVVTSANNGRFDVAFILRFKELATIVFLCC
jgi:hypothetical protein